MENIFTTIFDTVTSLIGSITFSGGSATGSGVLYWAYSFINMITDNTMLLIFCIALPLVGLGIGIIRRLVRLRA